MAEHVSESLKLFEQAHLTDTQTVVFSDSGSATIRLIRVNGLQGLRKEEMRNLAIPFNSTHI